MSSTCFENAFADIYAVIAKGSGEHRRRARLMDAETARHVFWSCCGAAAARGWKARLVPRSDDEKRTIVVSRRDGVGGESFALIAGIDVDSELSTHLATLEMRFEPVDGGPHGAGREWRFERRSSADPLRLADDSPAAVAPDLTPWQTERVSELSSAIEKRAVAS